MSLFVPHLKDADPALAASFLSPSLSLSPGYVEGTFSLVWKKTSSSTEDEQELFEKSTATLFETGMEGGKEYLVIRKKDGVDLEKKTVRISYLQWVIF